MPRISFETKEKDDKKEELNYYKQPGVATELGRAMKAKRMTISKALKEEKRE